MRRLAYVKQGINDLATVRPDLVDEWSPDNPMKPNEITAGSHMWATWKCRKCGYKWQAHVNMRTKGNNGKGTGCPRCAGFTTNSVKHSRTNDSAFESERLSSEFIEDKNGSLKLVDLSMNPEWKVWWRCSICGHDWQASLHERETGAKCPACIYKSLHPVQSLSPSIRNKWDSSRNTAPAENVDARTCKKYWWRCPPCGYSWQAVPHDVERTDCPVCSFQPSEEQVRFEKLISAVFHDEKTILHDRSLLEDIDWNGDDRTLGVDVFLPSLSLAFDYCDGHSIDDELSSSQSDSTYKLVKRQTCASKGIRLLYVYPQLFKSDIELRRALEDLSNGIVSYKFLSLGRGYTTRDKFDEVFPLLAGNFIKTVKENDLVPCEATPSSHRLCVWRCELCGEKFEQNYAHTSRDRHCRCENCKSMIPLRDKANDKRRFKPGESLGDLSPWTMNEWSSRNGSLTPFDVSSRSHLAVWWRCKNGHEWKAPVRNRTKPDHSRASGCPYCANKRVWTGWNDIATTDPELALDWSDENNLPSTRIGVWSSRPVEWKCHIDGMKWTASPNTMKHVESYRCPECRRRLVPNGTSKMENTVCEAILKRHPELAAGTMRNVRCLWTPDCFDRKNSKHKEIDMVFSSIRLGVEFDGNYWHSDDSVISGFNGYYKTAGEYREAKRKAAKDIGLQLVFVLEADWQRDPSGCLDKLDVIIRDCEAEDGTAWTRDEINKKTVNDASR